MHTQELINKLNEWEFKLSAYNLLLSTAYFDNSTIAPSDGADYRGDRLAYIAGEAYTIQIDPEIKKILKELETLELDEVTKRKVELYLKDIKRLEAIPKDLYTAFTKTQMEAENVWAKAKETDDYKLFEPYLKTLIDYSKQFAKLRNPNIDSYDLYLDDYEPGLNKTYYDGFFNKIKEELLPLIKQINNAKAIDDSFIYLNYPSDGQAKVMQDINEYLGYTKNWGYMGTSPHPFTNGLSCNDVRITTHYDEGNISSSIYSVIHEVGHAFYEHQMNQNYDGTILKAVSSGMHESQSRLFENYLGRRLSFIKNFYPQLQTTFPEQLSKIDVETFTNAINVSKPSFIRTDADELTYPIHILIRYEIEKAIFNETIDLDNLDQVWNEYYENYLGIKPPKASLGILQDIHWSGASFGYFPTYALGSAVAAQIINTMAKTINIDEVLANNQFKVITDWLKLNIQDQAAMHDLNDILLVTTGETFNPDYYINYLKDKYTKLYQL